MKRRVLLLALPVLLAGCSLFKAKERPPTTATYHDGKRTVTVVVPHDPTPSPVLGILEAVAGPILSLVGL